MVQVHNLQEQLRSCQEHLSAARADCSASAEYASKLESDLASLTEAYHDLQRTSDANAAELQSLRQAAQSAPAENGAAAGAVHTDALDSSGAAAADLAELQQEMDDLLVCLGQEEQKVEVLGTRLRELGIDAGALIAHIGDGEGDTDDEGDGAGGREDPDPADSGFLT